MFGRGRASVQNFMRFLRVTLRRPPRFSPSYCSHTGGLVLLVCQSRCSSASRACTLPRIICPMSCLRRFSESFAQFFLIACFFEKSAIRNRQLIGGGGEIRTHDTHYASARSVLPS